MTADPTKGDSPILDPGPIVEIDGATYPLRRLGVRDTLTLAKIIAIGARALGGNMSNEEFSNPDTLRQVLLAGLMAAETTVLDLMASLIGVTTKDLLDPERFPMSTPFVIAEALIEHQDLKAFFAHVRPLLVKFTKTQTT